MRLSFLDEVFGQRLSVWRERISRFAASRSGSVSVPATPATPAKSVREAERRKMNAALERLHDLLWEAREREARYRDLLDHHGDVILRRDSMQRLSFVNDAFCRTFGMKRSQALGQIFSPEIAERDCELVLRRGRTRAQVKIRTALGLRWFVWEEFAVRDGAGSESETQIVARDVTQEREQARALALAKDSAEAANAAKSRFLAAMSHEIRTPMNGVIGMTQLLLDTALSAEQKTYARAIETSGRSLLSLIDEVLDFSRIEAGHIELEAAEFDLSGMVEGVVELLAPRAREKGLEIAWLVAPALPGTLVGDAARLRQVLVNLVGNAIKFTAEGGVGVRVTARGEAADGAIPIRIAVSDTGPGVAEDARMRIFSEFEQAEQGPARSHGGAGLGLAISKRIAEAMGGALILERTGPDGSVFCADFRLKLADVAPGIGASRPEGLGRRALIATSGSMEPRLLAEFLALVGWRAETVAANEAASACAEAARQLAPYDAVIVDIAAAENWAGNLPSNALLIVDPADRCEIETYRARGCGGFLVRPVRPRSLIARLSPTANVQMAEAQSALRTESATQAGRHILLAEDNDINALLATHALTRAGHRVVRAQNGASAYAAAEEMLGAPAPFDIALLDIHMPDMDGVEAARLIRALYPAGAKAGAGRPALIALTANAFPEDRARYLASGLDDYLAKPFERDDLNAMIARWTRGDCAVRGV